MSTRDKSKASLTAGARSRKSAGLVFFREKRGETEVFLVHPGGPFWDKKDDGAWSIPKGEFADGEDALEAAKREFQEETGIAPTGDFSPLEPVRQPSGKIVHAWAARGDFDPSAMRSNTFTIELPKGSGKLREFPEVDRAAWFVMAEARKKILKGQVPLLDQLERNLGRRR